jgi:hypothetical protein
MDFMRLGVERRYERIGMYCYIEKQVKNREVDKGVWGETQGAR